MQEKPVWSGLVLVILLGCGPAGAHHSALPHFDLRKSLRLSGTVTAFRFVNPHSYIYVDVVGSDGRLAAWRCELPGRTMLERKGWTISLFPIGQRIRIDGSPARREAQVCYAEHITTEDGRGLAREADLTRGASPSGRRSGLPAPAERSVVYDLRSRDLSGLWVARGRPFRLPPGPLQASPTPSVEGGKAAQDYDQRFDDPALQCSPANIIFGWTHDQNVNQIIQTRDAVTLRYGYMDLVRIIHLDTDAHPKTDAPSLSGHSIGRWEGATLVVDTIGFQPGVLVPMAGLLHSNQLHVVERFTVDTRAGTLTRQYRVEDRLYLQAPYEGRDVLHSTSEPYRNFDCVELSGKNNLRTTRWGRQ